MNDGKVHPDKNRDKGCAAYRGKIKVIPLIYSSEVENQIKKIDYAYSWTYGT
ncbi:MAG TPA: hypothetical protein VFI78_01030 [Salinimicrobium sp.]|nr:hypothetical protein [Salinimicrobium sp.]